MYEFILVIKYHIKNYINQYLLFIIFEYKIHTDIIYINWDIII